MRQFRAALCILTACLTFAAPTLGQDHPGQLHADAAYARVTGLAGAVFFTITNNGPTGDRLIGARTDIAQKAEFHSHSMDANGVMTMGEIMGGIDLPPGEMHIFDRGGDHLMLMGLTRPVADADVVAVTLIFESGAELTLDVLVDNKRKPGDVTTDHSHDGSNG